MNCCEKIYSELKYSTLTDNKRQFNRLPLFKFKTNFDNFLALPNRIFWGRINNADIIIAIAKTNELTLITTHIG